MKLESLRDLENLIKLCRKMGIEAIEVDSVKMNLGPTPTIIKRTRTKTAQQQTVTPGGITEDIRIPEALSEEQLLFWSANIENQ